MWNKSAAGLLEGCKDTEVMDVSMHQKHYPAYLLMPLDVLSSKQYFILCILKLFAL